jgi:hypothetical protein
VPYTLSSSGGNHHWFWQEVRPLDLGEGVDVALARQADELLKSGREGGVLVDLPEITGLHGDGRLHSASSWRLG